MTRDDDEAPDPRHSRTATSPILIVLLAAGGLLWVGGVVVFGGGFLSAWRGLAVQAPPARPVVASAEPRASPDPAAAPQAVEREPPVALKDSVTGDGLTVRVVSVGVGKARLHPD